EDWNEYVEVLDQYFIANQLQEARLRAVFLSNYGRATNSLLRRLLVPRKPSEVSHGEWSAVLTVSYLPRPSVIVQRYLLYCRTQQEEPELTLDKAMKIVTSMEAAAKGAKQITQRPAGPAVIKERGPVRPFFAAAVVEDDTVTL
ncbi:hypothetical protein HPB47_014286, partial [Ixodes persulcatus]